ncbi:MAG: Mut7-C RNAse domain-containing protein [Candidatus Bathyarchaeota archaeon]|nr:Mut7-C RNAse domain-containing protein [Candidatus Bathyarchaeum tardum]
MDFIVDSMLGKLARWLRMLGHNVTYYRNFDDATLLVLAKTESRILVTRDLKLYQKALSDGLETFFVNAKQPEKRLALLANRFSFELEIDLNFSRCPKCNGSLVSVSKKEIKNKIPDGTFKYYDDFWQCNNCGQVYWKGAHWTRIQGALVDTRRALDLI